MGPTYDLSQFIFLTVSMSCVPVEGEWSGCAKREREREFQGEKRRNKSVGKILALRIPKNLAPF